MKLTFSTFLGAACLAIGFLGANTTASAIPITGQIDFSGLATTDTGNLMTATKFTSFSFVTTTIGTGTYEDVIFGTPVTMKPFTFNPTGSGVAALWSFVSLGDTYSFDLNSVTAHIYDPTTKTLSIAGIGLAYTTAAGYDATAGAYTFSTTSGVSGAPNTRFTFNSSTTALPDGGETVALLGLGLVAVEVGRRMVGARSTKA